MRRSALAFWPAGVILLAAASSGRAADVPADRDAAALAGVIDKLIAERWKEKGVEPAAPADDAEFLRRLTLDLTGRVPDLLTARDFIENPNPDKRAERVRLLLSGDEYAAHFTNVWHAQLLPPVNDPQRGFSQVQFDPWMHKQLKDNVGYDQVARALVFGRPNESGPQIFYAANEYKAENLAAATSRHFLGVKLECAQCHNHPFAKWTKQQFWEYTAFFAGAVSVRGGGAGGKAEVKIPGTERTATPHFLDGTAPKLAAGQDARTALADWMTSPDNPYFARASVNHLWDYFFGAGLIEPIDEESGDNPPSHPELLDELSRQFVAHHFDLKFIIKAITLSKTYQLTSQSTHPGPTDARLFARAPVRGLSPEQLFDSLAVATGLTEEGAGYPDDIRFTTFRFNPTSPRFQFLARFPNQDRRVETQTSILQALYFMNGKVTTNAVSLKHNALLKHIAEGSSVSVPRRVEQVFLIVLSRKPRPEERDRFVAYVEKGGPDGDQATALTDVFWVLLNSAEFACNH